VRAAEQQEEEEGSPHAFPSWVLSRLVAVRSSARARCIRVWLATAMDT